MASFESDETAKPKKKKKVLLVVGLVIGVPILCLLGLASLGALYMLTATEVPITEADRNVVLTAERLAEWIEDFTPDPQHASLSKVRYIDGSIEIEYEYDETENDEAPYLHYTVSYEPNTQDARIGCDALWLGMIGGIKL